MILLTNIKKVEVCALIWKNRGTDVANHELPAEISALKKSLSVTETKIPGRARNSTYWANSEIVRTIFLGQRKPESSKHFLHLLLPEQSFLGIPV
jgi:hypothetical protein